MSRQIGRAILGALGRAWNSKSADAVKAGVAAGATQSALERDDDDDDDDDDDGSDAPPELIDDPILGEKSPYSAGGYFVEPEPLGIEEFEYKPDFNDEQDDAPESEDETDDDTDDEGNEGAIDDIDIDSIGGTIST